MIQLNQLAWQDFVDRPNPVASALMAKMRIAPEDRPTVKAECIHLMTILHLDEARSQLIATFVDTYLRLNQAEKQMFSEKVAEFAPPEREKAMEIITSWELDGIEKGRIEEAQRLAIRQLRRRIGAVPEEREAQIRRLSIETVEDLAEALLDFAGPADLESWLYDKTNLK